ncbi:RDD family protein [Luteimonas sp. XNQY3]|nr:RDD family protein [Luteimonas sp. XNQY3]MCD9007858.1 RDD family protein [Luteimonas sp. XNQY3]
MSDAPATPPAPPRPWIGWRLLAMLYDLWPVLALWFATALPFVLIDAFVAGDVHHNIGPFSSMQWLLWAVCWGVAGLYAVISWRNGGQTLGMRPWRLRVRAFDGGRASTRALWVRFGVATLSLLAGGLGFWWAWVDRERLTWHDRASGTRVVREAKLGSGGG